MLVKPPGETDEEGHDNQQAPQKYETMQCFAVSQPKSIKEEGEGKISCNHIGTMIIHSQWQNRLSYFKMCKYFTPAIGSCVHVEMWVIDFCTFNSYVACKRCCGSTGSQVFPHRKWEKVRHACHLMAELQLLFVVTWGQSFCLFSGRWLVRNKGSLWDGGKKLVNIITST